MSEFKARIETDTTEYLVLDKEDLQQLWDAMIAVVGRPEGSVEFEALETKVQRLARRVAKIEDRQSTDVRDGGRTR